MQAFKLYFKVFKKAALITTLIYLIMFSFLSIIFSNMGTTDNANVFTSTKCRVAIINEDSSEFSNELENYISKNSKIVEINTSEKGIKDALFYRDAQYILTIPKGYGDAFTNNKPIELITQTVPDSMSGIFVDMMIDNYLKTYNLYLQGNSNLTHEQIIENVKNDLELQTEVTMTQKSKSAYSAFLGVLNWFCYPIVCIIIFSIGFVLNVLNDKNIRSRNLCAPINPTKFNLQIFLGNIGLQMVIFILFSLYAFILFPDIMSSKNGILFTINLFILSLVSLSLGFLIGNIAAKKALNPICNTVSLGMCFLGGAFVSQELLGDTVKKVAVVNPAFWFVKANNQISELSIYNWENLKSIVFNMGIEFAFAIAFLSIALVIIKQKSLKD